MHGEGAARVTDDVAAILFGGDPTAASADALAAVAAEVPHSVVGRTSLDDTIALLVSTGLATSSSDARRTLQQGGFRVNGHVLDDKTQLSDLARLHDRYLLLRRGKSNHHLVEIS